MGKFTEYPEIEELKDELKLLLGSEDSTNTITVEKLMGILDGKYVTKSPTSLNTGDDLNNISSLGWYAAPNPGITTTLKNLPPSPYSNGSSFNLFVIPRGRCFQQILITEMVDRYGLWARCYDNSSGGIDGGWINLIPQKEEAYNNFGIWGEDSDSISTDGIINVTIDNPDLELEDGTQISIYFKKKPSLSGGMSAIPTLNVNNLGGKFLNKNERIGMNIVEFGDLGISGSTIVRFIYLNDAWIIC